MTLSPLNFQEAWTWSWCQVWVLIGRGSVWDEGRASMTPTWSAASDTPKGNPTQLLWPSESSCVRKSLSVTMMLSLMKSCMRIMSITSQLKWMNRLPLVVVHELWQSTGSILRTCCLQVNALTCPFYRLLKSSSDLISDLHKIRVKWDICSEKICCHIVSSWNNKLLFGIIYYFY